MSNNRVWVRCSACEGEGSRRLLAKYYPSGGWGISVPFSATIPDREALEKLNENNFGPSEADDSKWVGEWDKWFAQHRHFPETTFRLEFESDPT